MKNYDVDIDFFNGGSMGLIADKVIIEETRLHVFSVEFGNVCITLHPNDKVLIKPFMELDSDCW